MWSIAEADGQVGDLPDPIAYLIVVAILVGGIALIGLATWYSARRPRR